MPTPSSWLPHLGGQKGEDSLILAMLIFHFPASTSGMQRSSHLLTTISGEWHWGFVIIFVSFATGNMNVWAVGKENP